jgi:hypothetical protein
MLGVLLFVGLRDYIRALIDLSYTRYQVTVRENWVSAQKQAGNRNPVVPEIYSEFFTEYNAMYGLNDILASPSFVNNVNYAITHGLDSVSSTTLEKWNAIYRNGDPSLMHELTLSGYLSKLSARKDVTLLVTSSELNPEWNGILNELGVSSVKEKGYLYGSAEHGFPKCSEEAGGEGMDIGGHYVWINASRDPSYCDILVDNAEYSNDLEGITFVAVGKADGAVLDSVTFDSAGNGSRHYEER